MAKQIIFFALGGLVTPCMPTLLAKETVQVRKNTIYLVNFVICFN